MTKADLAERIRNSVNAEELESIPVSEFNKNVLLEIFDMEFSGDVDEDAVKKLETLLQDFLARTWEEEPLAHKPVINACLALAFLLERPMHPQEKVHYITKEVDGKTHYYCSYNEKGTFCDYCAAEAMEGMGKNGRTV